MSTKEKLKSMKIMMDIEYLHPYRCIVCHELKGWMNLDEIHMLWCDGDYHAKPVCFECFQLIEEKWPELLPKFISPQERYPDCKHPKKYLRGCGMYDFCRRCHRVIEKIIGLEKWI